MAKKKEIIVSITQCPESIQTRLNKMSKKFIYAPNYQFLTDIRHVNDFLIQEKCTVLFCNPNDLAYTINESVLSNTKIHTVCSASTGESHIDTTYCRKNNIKVVSLKNHVNLLDEVSATSEHAFGLIISAVRRYDKAFTSRHWISNHGPLKGEQLRGMKLGVIGFGRLGQKVCTYAQAFGMNTFAYDPKYSEYEGVFGTKIVKNINHLFSICDVISIHAPLNPQTQYLVNESRFRHITRKGGIYLINVSRGDLVKEEDLIDALDNEKVKCYATDVLSCENRALPFTSPLTFHPNVIITPHMGGSTKQSQEIAYDIVLNVLQTLL